MTKRINLEELLLFINTSYIDDRLYIIVPHLYEKDIHFEIMWTGDANEPKWLVKQKSTEDSYERIETSALVSTLNNKKVNLIEVHVELVQKVLANLAHLSLIIERGEELFGKELVGQACLNLKKYYADLQAVIESVLVKKNKPKKKKAKLSLIGKLDGQD